MRPVQNARVRRVSPRQIQVITAPRRLEVLEALQSRGRSSVAEIAHLLGRRADGVHYHVNALAKAGFLRRARVRKGGRGRPAALWEVHGGSFSHRLQPRSALSRGAWTATATALLRAAGRDLTRAVAAGAARDAGPRRNTEIFRRKLWLNEVELRELSRRLRALDAFLRAHGRPSRGGLHLFTLALCPAATP